MALFSFNWISTILVFVLIISFILFPLLFVMLLDFVFVIKKTDKCTFIQLSTILFKACTKLLLSRLGLGQAGASSLHASFYCDIEILVNSSSILFAKQNCDQNVVLGIFYAYSLFLLREDSANINTY